MKTISVQDILNEMKIKEIMITAFSNKTGMKKESLEKVFDHITSRELDRIGKSLAEGKIDDSTFSNLKDLTLDNFFSEDKKIIKDK
jgi:hypothetical protein